MDHLRALLDIIEINSLPEGDYVRACELTQRMYAYVQLHKERDQERAYHENVFF